MSTALAGLRKTITAQLDNLRRYRLLGDEAGEARCNEHINTMLATLRERGYPKD